MILKLFALSFIQVFISSLSYAQSFIPGGIPLLVRSPYLNSWLSGGSGAPVVWPGFWSGNHTLGWAGFIRVDNDVYEWVGAAFGDGGLKWNGTSKQNVKLNDITITPTRTIYQLQAGAIAFNITYLSPIEPADNVLQSLPFGYVYFDAASTDGQSHRVMVYSDLSGEWLSFDSADKMQWDTTTASSAVFHSASRLPTEPLVEVSNMAHDGTLYHAADPSSPGMTWQTFGHYELRSWWLANGSLNNTKDTKTRAINDDFPVLAFANDLGTISSTSSSIVWAIGYARNPVVQQTTSSGNQNLVPYWTTKYSKIDDAISAFLGDFTNARSRAISLDQKILGAAQKISTNYADLVALAARQTFGGVELAAGGGNTPMMFMKDIGNSQRVNPVETMYASFPAFLYINPAWGRYLLEPVLQYEQSSQYTKAYAAPDLGTAYPSAAGSPNANLLRVIEDSGSMLIMAWAQARFSSDVTLLNNYYNTLKKWADQIISANALSPSGYQTADGLDSTNMTNLAIKGIIGVRAMAEISHTLGKTDDANKYQTQASTWASQWESSATSGTDHLASTYGQTNSWGLMYNLFPDKWLGMKLVSDNIYSQQSKFYSAQAQSANKYGFSFDSSNVIAKSQWTMFTAAITDISTRDILVKQIHDHVTDIPVSNNFPTTYSTQDGKVTGGAASPAQGAVFGLLSLNMQAKLDGLSGGANNSSSKKTNVGAIAGGVVGGVAALALFVVGFLFWRRRKHGDKARELDDKDNAFSAFFGGRKDKATTPDVLADYHVEPLAGPAGYSSHTNVSGSYNNLNQNQYQEAGGYTQQSVPSQSSQSQSYGAGSLQLTPLRLHNGETGDYYSTRSGSDDSRPQAPPLPRKGEYRPTPSADELTSPTSRTGAPSVVSSGGVSDASQLRSEMENLRREMDEMRSRAMYEPPPSYD